MKKKAQPENAEYTFLHETMDTLVGQEVLLGLSGSSRWYHTLKLLAKVDFFLQTFMRYQKVKVEEGEIEFLELKFSITRKCLTKAAFDGIRRHENY